MNQRERLVRIAASADKQLDEQLLERIFAHLVVTPGCWLWHGAHSWDGYAKLSNAYVHVLLHDHFFGPIPPGYERHHTCETKGCVRPSHLRVVTIREHKALTPKGLTYEQSRRTHCPRGHPYDDANTYHHQGHRHCLACRRIVQQQLHRHRPSRARRAGAA